MISNDRKFLVYSKWLKVHPRYYDSYGYTMWRQFNDFFYSLYDIEPGYHSVYDKQRLSAIARRSRVRKYLRAMSDSNLLYAPQYLLSLTFTDDVLNSTNPDTRLKYVRDYLNSTFDDYFACIDFGKKKGREHYHAIVNPSSYDYALVKVDKRGNHYYKPRDKLDWKYGYFSLRPITYSPERAVNYAFKCSSYAFKSASSSHKPFHKRCVSHFEPLFDDDFEEGMCVGGKL